MEPKTKQSLLVTVVGVTLFVALLRLSDVLAFAAKLIDLVLPILAGGILALFINVPMTGLEKRLKSLFRKAKKQPSAKAIHLLSFFITLLGVVLVLVLALTLLIPELVQSFHSLYLQIEANIPRWTAYLHAQDPDMGWLMSRLEGIDWEQLLHKAEELDRTIVQLTAMRDGLRHAAICPAPSHMSCPTFRRLLGAAARGVIHRRKPPRP